MILTFPLASFLTSAGVGGGVGWWWGRQDETETKIDTHLGNLDAFPLPPPLIKRPKQDERVQFVLSRLPPRLIPSPFFLHAASSDRTMMMVTGHCHDTSLPHPTICPGREPKLKEGRGKEGGGDA